MSVTTIYYTFTALLGIGMGATVTVYAPFLLSIGLSLGEVALVNALFWTIIIVAELPTGMLADGRSRAFSLKAGMVFQALGALSYMDAVGFWSAALAEGLIAIGMAFMSGAQQAWITDALTREGRGAELRRVFATETAIRTLLFIVGGLFGSLIALVSYRLIWLPVILTATFAIFICHKQMNGQGEPLERVSELEAFSRSWQHLRTSPALIWMIATMIVFGTVVSFNHFWSPYFEAIVGTVGLSAVWTCIYLGYMFAAWSVRRVTVGHRHEATHIVVALVLSGLGMLLLPFTSGLYVPVAAAVLHELGRGMFQPLTDAFVQHRVESSYRATFGSLQSFLGRAGFAVVPLFVWIGIDGEENSQATIGTVWIVCGLVLITGAIILWLLRPKT